MCSVYLLLLKYVVRRATPFPYSTCFNSICLVITECVVYLNVRDVVVHDFNPGKVKVMLIKYTGMTDLKLQIPYLLASEVIMCCVASAVAQMSVQQW
jgi:hypothetical protein